MTKQEWIDLIRRILKTNADLDFLLRLEPMEIETLIACIRERVEGKGGHSPVS